MLLIQIFFTIFFLAALIKVVIRYRRSELPVWDMLFWSALWVGGIGIMIKPDWTFYIARMLGVGRGADVVVYSALAILFFIIFRLTITIERLKKEITIVTRQKTLENQSSRE